MESALFSHDNAQRHEMYALMANLRTRSRSRKGPNLGSRGMCPFSMVRSKSGRGRQDLFEGGASGESWVVR